MVLTICKRKQFMGGRETGDRSHPFIYVWQVVGPSKGVPWSHWAVPLCDKCPEQTLSVVDPHAPHATSAGSALTTRHRGVYAFPFTPEPLGADERDICSLKPESHTL